MSSLRAFGGGELLGERLVRIVYLDEAGTSATEPTVVVAGIIVHGDHQLTALQRALQDVMDRHIPLEDRLKTVIHTCDLYGGSKYFDKTRKPYWCWDRRAALMRDIARIPAALNLHIAYGAIPKKRFAFSRLRQQGERWTDLQMVVGAAYLLCMFEVDIWFRQNAKRENCFFIAEDNRETKQFIKVMHQQHQHPDIVNSPIASARDKEYLPLRHIQEDPSFQPKRPAHPLILADFIAFMWKRRIMEDERSYEFCEPWQTRLASYRIEVPPPS